MADDFRSLNDFRLGATCDSVKAWLEKRNAPALPRPWEICEGQGYRTVRVYDLLDATRTVSFTPDNMVWKLGFHAHPLPKAGGRSARALQQYFEKFGRPALEDGISVDEAVFNPEGVSTLDKLDFRLAWASSHPNPAVTESTVVELKCPAQRQGGADCLSQQASASNESWSKHLGALSGVIVVARFHPTAHGMGSYTVETYLKNHLERASAATPAGKR